MKNLRKQVAFVALALGLSAGSSTALFAQTSTTTTSSTCTTAPTSITALSIERVLTLTDLLTTLTPNSPTSVLGGLQSGAEEVRTRLIYNPQQNTVTDTTFVVPAGSPIPTPLSTDITSSTLLSYVLTVSEILQSCQPTPSILIVGTITSSPLSPYVNFQGAPAAISLGYTTATPPVINNVVELIAGSILAYSASGTGTLTFPTVTVTPPGTTTGAPVVVLNPMIPAGEQVFQSPLFVTAMATDPNNLALTYSWSSSPQANFYPNNEASTNIYFVAGTGTYTITVTVMNSAGQATKQSFTVEYLGRTP
jgi:hypothetical protein